MRVPFALTDLNCKLRFVLLARVGEQVEATVPPESLPEQCMLKDISEENGDRFST